MNKRNGNGKKNGGTLTKPDRKPLSSKDMLLAELLADPNDGRTKDEKSVAAGYSPKWVYELLKRPEFFSEVQRRSEHHIALIRLKRSRVLDVLAQRAEQERVVYDNKGNTLGVEARDANEAAKLFLQSTGDIGAGATFVNHITNQNSSAESLEESVRRISALREVRFQEQE